METVAIEGIFQISLETAGLPKIKVVRLFFLESFCFSKPGNGPDGFVILEAGTRRECVIYIA